MHLLHEVRCPAEVVFDCLTNAARLAAVHPVIYQIDDLGDRRYLIYEKLLGIPFTYPATIEADAAAATVTMRATVFQLVTIRMQFRLEAAGPRCRVHETVNFRSFLPVALVLRPLFRKLHGVLFRNIETATVAVP